MSSVKSFDDSQSIYRVSEKLALVKPAEVDHLEQRLGFPLPNGYREFITTFGEGSLCDDVHINTPKDFFDLPGQTTPIRLRDRMGDTLLWGAGASGLAEHQILDLIQIASSSCGHYYGIHETQPGMLFILPDDMDVVRVDTRSIPLPSAVWYAPQTCAPDFVFFIPRVDRKFMQANRSSARPITATRVADEAEARWGTPIRVETPLTNCIAIELFFKEIGGLINVLTDSAGNLNYHISIYFDADHDASVKSFLRDLGFDRIMVDC